MQDRYIIERRGGCAGLKAHAIVDADALDPHDRAALEEIVSSDEPLARDPGADRFTYVVTRETEDGRTTREIPESVMPPAVTSLVTTTI
ncbi:protealysin inhibitor emfourin [Mycobacterium genavense]|uniref:protealysin inhibitor emfourin n=1 Tax=Mycobacterium genavense TaxID=36812 RepID=UPI000470DCCB|nr:protealysin inhibitor emfourin [Mycobacterium genavense]